jgi:hypothetical protein
MNPPDRGPTVKGVTERPAALLQAAFKVFESFRFTGLADADFILDKRDGRFKFLEINPRVWATIGFAQHAGVDLFTPYRDLARGERVEPDLRYREGIEYHRFAGELRLMLRRPRRLFGFVRDCLDPRVFSDFDWKDLGPFFPPSTSGVACCRVAWPDGDTEAGGAAGTGRRITRIGELRADGGNPRIARRSGEGSLRGLPLTGGPYVATAQSHVVGARRGGACGSGSRGRWREAHQPDRGDERHRFPG